MKKDKDIKNQEEKELDDLFSAKGNKMEKAIKRAKRHSTMRAIIITMIVVGIIAIGSNIFFANLVYRMEGNVQVAVDKFNLVSAPNIYIGKTSRYHDLTGGRSTYTTYKIIEDKVVYTGEKEYHYGIFTNQQGNLIGTSSPSILGYSYDEGDLKQRRFNELGQREMVFFYPYVEYGTIYNDLDLLEKITDDKYMEFAISFDKAYSIDEAKELIPEGITLSWYWVDDIKEGDREQLQAREEVQSHPDGETYIMPYPARVRSERTAYGIKAYNQHGEILEKPEEDFIRAIEQGRSEESRYQNQFNELYEVIKGDGETLKKENIKVLGVVVTGDKESLKQLQQSEFVRASTLGIVTDQY